MAASRRLLKTVVPYACNPGSIPVAGCRVKQGVLYYNACMETTMTSLESYFEFVRPSGDGDIQAIRIAGTRVGIEHVLHEYLGGASPEELALRFPTVSLEQIHATITFFLAQRQQVIVYLQTVWQQQAQDWERQAVDPSPFVESLRHKLAAARREHYNSDLLFGLAAD